MPSGFYKFGRYNERINIILTRDLNERIKRETIEYIILYENTIVDVVCSRVNVCNLICFSIKKKPMAYFWSHLQINGHRKRERVTQ